MKPRVLNAWAQVTPLDTGIEVSNLCFESTAPPLSVGVRGPEKLASGDYVVHLVLSGLGLTMAPDEILVADGLVRKMRVYAPITVASRDTPAKRDAGRAVPSPPLQVAVDVILEHPAAPSVSGISGMPFRTEFTFPRSILTELFSGKIVAIDPGHGGRDAGLRGPINLLEKNVTLDLARELATLLRSCGSDAVMSRRKEDSGVDVRAWSMRSTVARPDILVEIHASGEKEPMARSYHVYARRGSGESNTIAEKIAGSLTERIGITFSGVEPMDFSPVPLWPAVRVEPLCLTHFVDEANFRAPLFRKRIAQAIFNGISRYLSWASKGG